MESDTNDIVINFDKSSLNAVFITPNLKKYIMLIEKQSIFNCIVLQIFFIVSKFPIQNLIKMCVKIKIII